MKALKLFFFFLVFQTISFAQQEAMTLVILYEDGSWSYPETQSLKLHTSKIANLEIPKTNADVSIIRHTGFSLLYNEAHEQASWVAYELTREKTAKGVERTDKFLPDPKVLTGTATNKDYEKSGYDRGHLAPAADMSWSEVAMAESFYFSNMSPQLPGFNRGVWKRVEEQVRLWAVENERIHIVTGPILTEGLNTIGKNEVSIPNHYYKVILDYTSPNVKGIGFIIPHESSSLSLQHFAVTIDSVEILTGIDFFPSLPDSHEYLIEKTLCISCWTWGNTTPVMPVEEAPVVPSQCKGITKSGSRCKNKTSDKDGFCHLHKG
jgi:endonuclease G